MNCGALAGMPRAGLMRMPQDIQRDRVQQLQAQGAAIVEVLPSKEFEHEHLPHAVSLPLSDLRAESAERVIGGDKQRPVVTYCQGSD
jgi:rhodanese-related sulfurtransferase